MKAVTQTGAARLLSWPFEYLHSLWNNNTPKGKVIEDRFTKDTFLVTDNGHAENVKDLIEEFKNKNYEEALQHVPVYRQWGYYTILEIGPMYKVKRLCVIPGKSLSYQLHHHRAEHWIVVKGTAKVVKEGQEMFLHENESVYVPKSVTHRIENPGKMELHIIEVQTGGYLEEDDIERIEGE